MGAAPTSLTERSASVERTYAQLSQVPVGTWVKAASPSPGYRSYGNGNTRKEVWMRVDPIKGRIVGKRVWVRVPRWPAARRPANPRAQRVARSRTCRAARSTASPEASGDGNGGSNDGDGNSDGPPPTVCKLSFVFEPSPAIIDVARATRPQGASTYPPKDDRSPRAPPANRRRCRDPPAHPSGRGTTHRLPFRFVERQTTR